MTRIPSNKEMVSAPSRWGALMMKMRFGSHRGWLQTPQGLTAGDLHEPELHLVV
jgi:hypothetical protein